MTNEVIKAMIERRSCRKFKAEQIKDEELQAILEAGKYAATGKGLQSPKMVVIQNPEVIAKLSKWNADIMGVTSDPFYGAPTVILVSSYKIRYLSIYNVYTFTSVSLYNTPKINFCQIKKVFNVYKKSIKYLEIYLYYAYLTKTT